MKSTRKIVALCSTFILSFSISVTAFAHPGRLDRFGGHWNRKTEKYHYHNTEDKTHFSDHHMHMMSDEYSKFFKKISGSDKSFDIPVKEISSKEIISLLDAADLDRAFVLSGSYILGMAGIEGPDEYNDVKKENNFLAMEVAKHPNRLIGFFSVNPLKDYALQEIDRCFDTLKLTGLKLHFTNSGVDLNNPEHLVKIQELFSHCAEKQIPILLHFRSRSPEYGKKDAEILIDKVISKNPKLKLQLAHLGGWGGFDKSAKEVLQTFIQKYSENSNLNKENIFFDLGAMIVTEREHIPGMLEMTTDEDHAEMVELIKSWGLDKIAFGTDYMYQTPQKYIDSLKSALPLTEAEFNDIMDNDIIKSFSIDYDKHFPVLKDLEKLLKEGVDYSAPFSTDY